MPANFEKISILGVRVDVVTLDSLLNYVIQKIKDHKKIVISNVNVFALNLAQDSTCFRELINNSQVVFCDGFGIKWAAKFLTGKDLHRYTPPDWFDRLATECEKNNFSIYFLGARQEVIEKAVFVMNMKFPALNICGFHHGYFDKSELSSDNQKVVAEINKARPDILLVGFGMPMQENWISKNRDKLNVHVIFPVGAYFDYLSGQTVRAPRWMTDFGLEWLGRLVIEPRRLWKRYVLGIPLFLWRVLKEKFR